jgi:hypothetical protein
MDPAEQVAQLDSRTPDDWATEEAPADEEAGGDEQAFLGM